MRRKECRALRAHLLYPDSAMTLLTLEEMLGLPEKFGGEDPGLVGLFWLPLTPRRDYSHSVSPFASAPPEHRRSKHGLSMAGKAYAPRI
jgi:hypothetical protein